MRHFDNLVSCQARPINIIVNTDITLIVRCSQIEKVNPPLMSTMQIHQVFPSLSLQCKCYSFTKVHHLHIENIKPRLKRLFETLLRGGGDQNTNDHESHRQSRTIRASTFCYSVWFSGGSLLIMSVLLLLARWAPAMRLWQRLHFLLWYVAPL